MATLAVRCYGFYFGLAYAVARVEEPWAAQSTWIGLAKDAAATAMRYGGNVPKGEN